MWGYLHTNWQTNIVVLENIFKEFINCIIPCVNIKTLLHWLHPEPWDEGKNKTLSEDDWHNNLKNCILLVLEMEDFFKEIFYIFPGKTLNINCGYSDPKGYNENKLEIYTIWRCLPIDLTITSSRHENHEKIITEFYCILCQNQNPLLWSRGDGGNKTLR